MEKYFILTELFQPTALKVSKMDGPCAFYSLVFRRVPWEKSDLDHTIFYLLDGDYHARSYLDKDPPDPDLNYAKWRDSLDNVGIGIQAWLVAIKSDRTKGLRLYDGMDDSPQSIWDSPEEPIFYYYSEWGWRFNSSSDIEIRACRAGAEKLGYKPIKFLVPEAKPAISYTWPSENRRNPKAMNELEALLFKQLENSYPEPSPQPSTAVRTSSKQFNQS